MNKKISITLVSLLSTISLFSCKKDSETSFVPPVEDDKVHIIVLAGQSGARGKAHVNDLADEDKEENDKVDILAEGLTMPQLTSIPDGSLNTPITPVHVGLGDSGNEFGPELGIARQLATRYKKGEKSRKALIVKYSACGSTFTSHWYSKSLLDDETCSSKIDMKQIREDKNGDPTGPLTKNLYSLVDKAISTLKDEGYESVIDGAIFCHGEQDAKFTDNMDIYETALKDFIKDFREYYNSDDLPFVVTEAGTNAARYSNKLRDIQKKVSNDVENVSFVKTGDLYTNSFEPWHFDAKSNITLGQRMAEELIHLNDNRKVVSIDDDQLHIPVNSDVMLPTYLNATFDDGTTGIVKADYKGDVDRKSTGDKKVTAVIKTNWPDYSQELNVKVDEYPEVDGTLSDWNGKLNVEGKFSVGFKKAEEGLYVQAKVDDDEIYTDGESWEVGDMGQRNENDDLILYLTDKTAKDRIPVFLSSDNLLRIYQPGTTSFSPASNMLYKGFVTQAKYSVKTTGETNVPTGSSTCKGMTMELYIPYEEIGIEDSSSLRILAGYSDISKADANSKKVNTTTYLNGLTGTSIDMLEDSYISLENLL